MHEMTAFTQVLEFVGTFAFAISGIRMAAQRHFDWFGAFVVGIATAIGGGTLRDIMLNVTPFWMTNGFDVVCTALALASVIIFKRQLVKRENAWFIFDTIGLALFTVVGLEKTIAMGFPFWTAIIMGTITGAAGGVLRDVFINEVPLIFRKEIYAIACIIGGMAYHICYLLGQDPLVCEILCGTIVFAVRVLAVRYHLCLPIMQDLDEKDSDNEKK